MNSTFNLRKTIPEHKIVRKVLKSRPERFHAKIKVVNFNSRASNALFSAVTNEKFKKISSSETAQEAWTILQTTYEGTKTIEDSKLQRLTISF